MTTLLRVDARRWTPIREVVVLKDEFSRLLNGSLEVYGRQALSSIPALDASETATELVYLFDLPGIGQDAISVEVEDGTLTISAERASASKSRTGAFSALSARTGPFRARSACRRAWPRTRSRRRTRMACSRSTSPSPSRRGRRGSRSESKCGRRSKARAGLHKEEGATLTCDGTAIGRLVGLVREALADPVDDRGHVQGRAGDVLQQRLGRRSLAERP